jgi:hypothetical protein
MFPKFEMLSREEGEEGERESRLNGKRREAGSRPNLPKDGASPPIRNDGRTFYPRFPSKKPVIIIVVQKVRQ